MPASSSPAPHGMNTVSPHLVVAGAAEAIEFYKKAFDATEMFRLKGPDGRIWHASLCIKGSSVMLVDEFPEHGSTAPKTLGGSPVSMHIFVDDVDAAVAQAVAVGATLTMPVSDMFWGDRFGAIEDPFGHKWTLATHLRDMTPDEIHAALNNAVQGR